MQKGQTLIFIILAIVTVGFIGVMFYVGKQTPKPPPQVVTSAPSPTPSPNPVDETANPDSIGANWKTYTNSNLTFFKKRWH